MARKSKKKKTETGAVTIVEEASPAEFLSLEERQELKECEKIIRRGWDTFLDVGKALAKIQRDRLYRADFKTFELYCTDKWQYKKSQAYRLIGAAEVVEHLSPIGDKLPLNESQVRPLLGLEPEQQIEAWKAALEKSGKGTVTAKIVRESAAQFQAPKEKTTAKASKRDPLLATALLGIEAAYSALQQNDVDAAKDTLEELKRQLQ